MIKLEALRVFVTVAETGNIKDAAQLLCRSASAVSMTLKQIEEEVGGLLFETDRKNSLTALGAYVLESGRTQIQNYDRAINRIRSYADNKIGHLTLASVPSAAANLVPGLLPEFVKDRPGIEIELFDLDTRNVRLFVEAGQADIGIAGKPLSQALVTFEPLFFDRFKVICCSKNHLNHLSRPIQWADLKNEVLILNGASQKIESARYHTLAEKASIKVHNVTSLIALAKSGLGITLLPALSTTDLPSGVSAIDLADDRVRREVGLLHRREGNLSPIAAAFRRYTLEQMPVLAKQLQLEPA